MMTIEKKAVKAGKFVDTKHVDTVIKNYKQKRWAQNSERLGKEDSLSVWFSVADIEAFLEKAKQHNGDGVRFYFGAYDEDYAENPLYAGRQTIVMVATKQKETLMGTTDKDIYINQGAGSIILGYNMGRMCPPVCQATEGGTGIGITIVDKGDGGLVVA
jgi:hypothetical protein